MLKKILEKMHAFDEKYYRLSKLIACTAVFLAGQSVKLICFASFREAIAKAIGL